MSTRERWGTRIGLVLAMAGNAVGLGNFLRFPAQVAQNGGGVFLVPYFISFLLMGLPLLWVEWAIGRYGGQYGEHSTPGMFDHMGRYRWLKYVGVFGLFTNLTVAAYYCYLESWTLAYVWHSAIGTFSRVDAAEFFPRYLGVGADSVFALPLQALLFFPLTLALNTFILSRGLVRGIELAAKIGLPLLVVFAVVLAVRGLSLQPGDPGVVESPIAGLGFIWTPQLSGLLSPTTWMAAAGQIFFTLSVGMGSIHCYASYVRAKQDIALNAAAAGWMNEFVEVVLGGSIMIPIATAYLGLVAVQTATAGGSGFGLGFLTIPTLLNNWGWFAPLAGAMWFGLLFFAGITSSLAMGQPILAFLQDKFAMSRVRAALAFGTVTFSLGFICVWLYPGGAFDEFDFWSGTFSLVIFALAEAIVFAWIFGINRGWAEITRGADLVVPNVFRFIIKFVTPVFILVVFVGALIQPMGRAWGAAFRSLFAGEGWPFAPESVLGRILHLGDPTYAWFDALGQPTVALVQDGTRLLLLLVFLACAALVWMAWRRMEGEPS
ncbi:MAG: sodium-dependent transporter [Gemmatimonadota bacterium]|nr:MAG: sodium-dependent transporter [Gemmatimonadota bacterium]